jgi:hypothetical protein
MEFEICLMALSLIDVNRERDVACTGVWKDLIFRTRSLHMVWFALLEPTTIPNSTPGLKFLPSTLLSLSLVNSHVDDSDVTTLPIGLKKLNLSFCNAVSQVCFSIVVDVLKTIPCKNGISKLKDHCSNLRKLNVSYCSNISELHRADLPQLLTHLKVFQCWLNTNSEFLEGV